ncbi:hypothetical protein ONZ45_g10542 [Pleurotus djamor]|nr:hypothetical protein ONZ45_g10542 [Pleurotus djamor]
MTPVFPKELLKLVASEAGAVDRKLVYSLLLVSKAFYSFAAPIFYKSIVVVGVYCSDRPRRPHSHPDMGPHTRMRFDSESLDALHSALASNPALSSHIETFIVINNEHSMTMSPMFLFQNDQGLWQRLGHIFATLDNIKHLSISPSNFHAATPLQQLPPSVAITHLSTESHWDYQDILQFLTRPSQRRAIQYLRILADGDPRFRPDPRPSGSFVKLHTIHGYPQLWHTFVSNGAPVEHLAGQFSDVVDFIDPALVFRGIRTLEISSWSQEAVAEPLPHLKSVELLYVTVTTYGARIPLEDFLSIPSKDLKYLSIDSSEDHEQYAEELLDRFPSLILLDFQRIGPPTPLRRYTRRRSPTGFYEVTREEIYRSRRNPSYPPAFMSWWELLETDFKSIGLEFQPLSGENV